MTHDKCALVFGATGCIGTHLIESLVNDGFWVRGVSRCQEKSSVAHDQVYGDLSDIDFVNKCFGDKVFDEVYQLAADMGGAWYINAGMNDADIMSNSALININIVKCCVKHRPKRILFSSSACVYPVDDSNNSECHEEDAYPANPWCGYGWEKIFTEKMLYSFYKQYGLNIRIARLHSIVGEHSKWCGGREKAHSALARKVAEVDNGGTIEVYGDGTQIRTFLYVKDCVEGITKLMRSDCIEPINIGSNVAISINEYIDILRQISGKQFNVSYVPGPIGASSRYCDIEKAKKIIDWEPITDIIEATKKTYDWISNNLKMR